MKKSIFFLSLLLLPTMARASTLIGNVYYKLYYDDMIAIVSSGSNEYAGNISIPAIVVYSGKTFQVVNVSSHAFEDCSELISVTIPSSVTYIGECAFKNCTKLKTVTLGNGIKYIGVAAFYNCVELTNITLPNSLISIPDNAFSGCSGLTKLTIPNSVTSIGNYAFSGCVGLKEITISCNLAPFAFEGCTGLTKITIENGCQQIQDDAFKDCTGLTELIIPNSVIGMSGNPFEGCNLKSLIFEDGVETLNFTRDPVYSHPITIDSLYLGRNIHHTTNHNYIYPPFEGSSVQSLTIGKCVTTIESEAFSNCGLTSLTIPNNVTMIGDGAFAHCSGLKELIIEDGTQTLSFLLLMGPFYASPIETMYLGRNITYNNGDISPFNRNSSLTDLTIGDQVTSIGNYAFSRCSGLTSVTIPSRVTSIGNYAFEGCTGLVSVTIPIRVTSIGEWSFAYCNSLTSVTIPRRVSSIGSCAFLGCYSMNSIIVASGNSTYDSRNNCNAIIQKSNSTLIQGCNNTIIPNSVTTIGEYAFCDCWEMKSITIPNSITSIGSAAFDGCYGLREVHSNNPTPPNLEIYSFSDETYRKATLYVPIGCISAYKNATYWQDFINIQEDVNTGIDIISMERNQQDVIFTLDGRRIAQDKAELPQGIYIMNGEKVFIK